LCNKKKERINRRKKPLHIALKGQTRWWTGNTIESFPHVWGGNEPSRDKSYRKSSSIIFH